MANDIIDINVSETVETVAITVNPNLTTVNINRQVPVGVNGQDLQSVTDIGASTSNSITANSFVKSGGTSAQILAANGSVITAGTNITISGGTISSTGGASSATNLTTSQTASNFTINSSTGDDASVPLGNGTLAGATLNDYTTAEKTKLAGIEAGANLGVPYTGATSDVNLGEFGIQLGNLEFDNTPTNIPTTAGSVYYNDSDGTLNLILKGGNVTLQVGQETVIRVVNKTSTNVSLLESNYQAVRITGAQGQRPKVDLAQATNDVLSAETIGLVTETIANNQEGFITTSGLVRGINTTGSLQGETWLDGDILYLSPTVAGSITKVKPVAPNHLIIIGYVISAHITQGTIFVKVDNGYELNELHNVKINGVANNNVLAYTLSTSIWENKTVETALGYTPYNATNPDGYQTASQVQTIADAKVANTITNGVTTSAPNQDVVFDALALKANDSSVVHLTGNETIAGTKTFSSNIVIPGTGSALILSASYGGTVSGLTTTTYPDLTELSYVKGVTSAIQTQFSGKQATLISGNNIKSINGNSLLGSGDLIIASSTPTQSAYSILANNTALSAVPTEQVFENITNATYDGATPTWTGTTAPSGATQHTYSLSQVGNMVTLTINLSYATAGSNLTGVTFELPSTAPTPALPTSVSVAGEVVSYASGAITTSKASVVSNISFCSLRLKSTSPNVCEVSVTRTVANYRHAYATIQYFV
jgi:hypothetical protein